MQLKHRIRPLSGLAVLAFGVGALGGCFSTGGSGFDCSPQGIANLTVKYNDLQQQIEDQNAIVFDANDDYTDEEQIQALSYIQYVLQPALDAEADLFEACGAPVPPPLP